MKSIFPIFLITSGFCVAQTQNDFKEHQKNLVFTENKGQVGDQFYKPRPDVLFSGTDGKMNFFLMRNGVSYQLYKRDSLFKKVKSKFDQSFSPESKNDISAHRIDVNFLFCNQSVSIKASAPQEGYFNYYTEVCPLGITEVRSFAKITYKNIYNNIDLIWAQQEGCLKYDFRVCKGADYRIIQLNYAGAENIYVNGHGELIVVTPLGNIVEKPPFVTQGNRELKSSWVVDGNIVSFEIEHYDPNYEMTIDPTVRHWGTYYGGIGSEDGSSCATDTAGNVYMAGSAAFGSSNLITSGAHQTVYGGSYDAFLVKFNTNGVRQWSTYYGGAGDDYGYSCATDIGGNIYMCGTTTSSNNVLVISTPGCHQVVHAGLIDAYLVKFNPAGIRQWGTYYGGSGNDHGNECRTDRFGNIFMAGTSGTSTGTVIATVGVHQSVYGGGFDAYLVRFNTNGIRQWGTYYGGLGADYGYSCSSDSSGNTYLTGNTNSATGTVIASATGHQTVFAGGLNYNDAFLAKFDSTGQRLWGTYYGGYGDEGATCCVSDLSGNVYMVGATNTGSGTAIATPGSIQPNYGGPVVNLDAYFVKFNPLGIRQWGTYYGGSGTDIANGCAIDGFGNVYFSGTTTGGGSVMITPNSFQIYSANCAFLAKFTPNGIRKVATGYGGTTGSTVGNSCVTDKRGNVFMCGLTSSSSGTYIASPNGHQTTFGNSSDAYLVKFLYCPNFSTSISTTSTTCQAGSNGSASISVIGGTTPYTYSWSPPLNSTLSGVSNLTNTTYSITVRDSIGCRETYSVGIGYVNASPILSVTASASAVCRFSPVTLTSFGAVSYTWSNNSTNTSIAVNPSLNTTYSVTGQDLNGCFGSASYTVSVFPSPTVSVNSGSICTGDSFTIVSSGASTYLYSGGSSIVTPSLSTSYSVVGVSVNGCLSTNTAVSYVLVHQLPAVSTTVNPSTMCVGQSCTIIASGAKSYSWSTGLFTDTCVTNPIFNTTYTVIGTDTNSCNNMAVASVSVRSLPTLFISSSSTMLPCGGGTATLAVTGANTYTWNIGITGGLIVVSPTTTIIYIVTGTALNSCTNTIGIIQPVASCVGFPNTGSPNDGIELFPNPTQGILTINSTHYANTYIIIYNSLGEQILTAKLLTESTILDLSMLASGIYSVQIRKDSLNANFKVVKE